MKREIAAPRRIPILDSLPVFHLLSLVLATAVWWLFMRVDNGPVEMFLADEPGIHIPFILVIAGMLHFYLKATALSKSRASRIITAVVCPFIGVSTFFFLMALLTALSGLGAVVMIYAAFIAPLCLLTSWKAMLFPMMLTCCLAEHVATLGSENREAQQKKMRETLRSPAANYLFLLNGRVPDVSRPHRF